MEIESYQEQAAPGIKLSKEEEEEKRKALLMIKIDNFVKLRPFMQRYTRLVKLDERFDMNMQWVRQHSNKLILFGITRQHPLI